MSNSAIHFGKITPLRLPRLRQGGVMSGQDGDAVGDGLFDLHPYREGDLVSRLHWPSYMRRRDFVVRRYEATDQGALLILLDASASMNGGEDQRERTEREHREEELRKNTQTDLTQTDPTQTDLTQTDLKRSFKTRIKTHIKTHIKTRIKTRIEAYAKKGSRGEIEDKEQTPWELSRSLCLALSASAICGGHLVQWFIEREGVIQAQPPISTMRALESAAQSLYMITPSGTHTPPALLSSYLRGLPQDMVVLYLSDLLRQDPPSTLLDSSLKRHIRWVICVIRDKERARPPLKSSLINPEGAEMSWGPRTLSELNALSDRVEAHYQTWRSYTLNTRGGRWVECSPKESASHIFRRLYQQVTSG